jgi:hypothetical protein
VVGHQVSWGDTNGEVVGHKCNFTYASGKKGKCHYNACDTKHHTTTLNMIFSVGYTKYKHIH